MIYYNDGVIEPQKKKLEYIDGNELQIHCTRNSKTEWLYNLDISVNENNGITTKIYHKWKKNDI